MVARLGLIAALAATAIAQDCDYYNDEHCINPKATAAHTIPFSPLFSSPAKFVYAVAELDESEKAAIRKRNVYAIPATYQGPVLETAFWLEYDQNSLNDDRSQSRNYYTFALETHTANEVGGEDNGCANLLGAKCVKNLKELIARQTYSTPDGLDGGLGTAIGNLYGNPPQDLGCPPDIFGAIDASLNHDAPLLLNAQEPFATYSGSFVREALASGNSSYTYGTPQLRFRTLAEQGARAAVGFTVGWPMVNYGEEPSYPLSDVTVETVCVRVGTARAATRGAGRGRNGGAGLRFNRRGL